MRSLFTLTACAALAACAAADSTAAPPSTVVIPLQPYFRELRRVLVVVGADTLSLLFDTGGGSSAITPEVARRIGCQPFGRQVGQRMHGDPVEFQSCDSATFDLGRWTAHRAPVSVFDLNALLPPELPRLDGVLSLDSFQGQVITIDWSKSELVIHSSSDRDAALAANGVPVRFATGVDGSSLSALVPVHGRRGLLWFLLDSGDMAGTLLAPHVLRDSLLGVEPDSIVAIGVGDRPAERLPVIVSPIILDGVLGTAFLLRRPITLDLRSAP